MVQSKVIFQVLVAAAIAPVFALPASSGSRQLSIDHLAPSQASTHPTSHSPPADIHQDGHTQSLHSNFQPQHAPQTHSPNALDTGWFTAPEAAQQGGRPVNEMTQRVHPNPPPRVMDPLLWRGHPSFPPDSRYHFSPPPSFPPHIMDLSIMHPSFPPGSMVHTHHVTTSTHPGLHPAGHQTMNHNPEASSSSDPSHRPSHQSQLEFIPYELYEPNHSFTRESHRPTRSPSDHSRLEFIHYEPNHSTHSSPSDTHHNSS